MLAFWAILGAWMALRLAETGRRRWAVALAALTGIAAATKLVGAALLLFVWLGWYAALLKGAEPARWWRRILRATLHSAWAAAIAIIVFVIVDPYAIIDGTAFLNEAANQAAMARGDPRFPYILQFFYTLPYIYPFVQNLTRGWGGGAGLLVWAGLVWGTARTLLARRLAPWSVLTLWALAFFLVLGSWHTKFPRYLLPMMPIMSVLAACMLAAAWNRWRRGFARAGLVALILVLVAMTSVYAIAMDGVFGREHPWVSASRWIYENVSRGTSMTTEYWDMALPLPLDVGGERRDRSNYAQKEFSLYYTDTAEKWEELAGILASTEYYIVASPRVYGPTGFLSEVYPTTSRFYELLFQEQLGFILAHWESNDPQMLGVRLVENPFARAKLSVPAAVSGNWNKSGTFLLPGADESWTVYDRPLTLIFQNKDHLPSEEILRILAP
jgi:MFS family permease